MSHTLSETEAPSQKKLHRHLRRNFAMICCSLSKSPWRSYNPHPWPYKSVLAHLLSLSFSTPATLASFLFLECLLSFVILFFSLWCGLPHCSLNLSDSAQSHLESLSSPPYTKCSSPHTVPLICFNFFITLVTPWNFLRLVCIVYTPH